jgi:membrane protease YdiL (CAAX protease family)
VVTLDVILAAAGVIYGGKLGISPTISTPIIIAFLVQAALFLLPGFPGARQHVENSFKPKRLAILLVASAVTPYLIYSIPLGLFSGGDFLALLSLAAVAPVLFVIAPPRKSDLSWQDLVAMVVLVSPVISGLTSFFRDVFPSPEGIERLDILGKLMVVSVGAMAFLSLRGVPGADFRFIPRWIDLRVGAKHFFYYLPIGIPLSLAIGLVEWAPRESLDWTLLGEIVGVVLGIFVATALAEELCFRGILQNLLTQTLRKPLAAQAIAALAFGAVHLSFRFYPNWRLAMAAVIAGWFYGNAYREGRSVAPAAITHTLVVVTWTFLFR